jgi:6-phosphogluconolactonase
MIRVLSRGLGLVLIAVLRAACSADDDGNNPLPTEYKYFAFVANMNSASVSADTINATTGALTAVTGSPFAAGDGPCSVAVIRIKQ